MNFTMKIVIISVKTLRLIINEFLIPDDLYLPKKKFTMYFSLYVSLYVALYAALYVSVKLISNAY